MNKMANIWEYKVSINAIIANFVCVWKSQIPTQCDTDLAFTGEDEHWLLVSTKKTICDAKHWLSGGKCCQNHQFAPNGAIVHQMFTLSPPLRILFGLHIWSHQWSLQVWLHQITSFQNRNFSWRTLWRLSPYNQRLASRLKKSLLFILGQSLQQIFKRNVLRFSGKHQN